jgi:triphosphoribosyl-dephospho-CoA synthase
MCSLSEEALRRAFLAACRAELHAPKPGNVHVHADGHGMSVDDFLRSAEAASVPLCRPGRRVGARIRDAVEASRAAVDCNTNLGIVLLAAPLLAAAERGGALRAALTRVLDELTIDDARDAFAAIARANPAGLGRVPEQDVAAPPTTTLREAMQLAADRDLVARQYATGYADIFAVGVARLACKAKRIGARTTTDVFLDYLTRFPDSHIARKFGLATADAVRAEAVQLRSALTGRTDDGFPLLLAFDASLKERGLNPGTSADLTVASLLAFELEHPGSIAVAETGV